MLNAKDTDKAILCPQKSKSVDAKPSYQLQALYRVERIALRHRINQKLTEKLGATYARIVNHQKIVADSNTKRNFSQVG